MSFSWVTARRKGFICIRIISASDKCEILWARTWQDLRSLQTDFGSVGVSRWKKIGAPREQQLYSPIVLRKFKARRDGHMAEKGGKIYLWAPWFFS
jgi:hypothetical protein